MSHRRSLLPFLALPFAALLVACDDPPGPGEDGGPVVIDPPTDDLQPVVISDVPPPPISGGTLHVLPDGLTAVVADPDRDRVLVVDLASSELVHEIALEPGDEPGRVVSDAAGNAHIALRRGGAVVTIDPASGSILARREVCAAPRGIASWNPVEGGDQTLVVACASGELVELLSAPEGGVLSKIFIEPDLRDVVFTGNGTRAARRTLVSSFRSARVITLGPTDEVEQESSPEGYQNELTMRRFSPSVAWRMVPQDDGAVVLHQRSATVPLAPVSPDVPAVYYEAMDCGNSVVHAATTTFDAAGHNDTQPQSGGLGTFALAVDIAYSADDPYAADPLGAYYFVSATGKSVNYVSRSQLGVGADACVSGFFGGMSRTIGSEPIAVDYHSNGDGFSGTVVVQVREPSMLVVYDNSLNWKANVMLGGDRRADSGHALFHGNPDAPSATIACASCHPEGRDDGHVWQFADVGKRRTQSLEGNVMDTAPFHWAGDLPKMDDLMSTVFVDRMRGQPQSPKRIEALTSWLRTTPTVGASDALDNDAIERGEALFKSDKTQCSTCHAGDNFTDNTTVDVGTGEKLQVPSLVNVRNRAPFMHDGCAATLYDRFDPKCGGTEHGEISELTEDEIDDLVAYMMSL